MNTLLPVVLAGCQEYISELNVERFILFSRRKVGIALIRCSGTPNSAVCFPLHTSRLSFSVYFNGFSFADNFYALPECSFFVLHWKEVLRPDSKLGSMILGSSLTSKAPLQDAMKRLDQTLSAKVLLRALPDALTFLTSPTKVLKYSQSMM